MFGAGKTYFSESPVIIEVGGLEWPDDSPFDIVRLRVMHNSKEVGVFPIDALGQSDVVFNISSALKAIWAGHIFTQELAAANAALTSETEKTAVRSMRDYSLVVSTEYMSSDDGGVFTETDFGPFTGGQCVMGGLTEMERSTITNEADADVSHWEHTGVRNGDASTKPTSSYEKVGRDSITSWVDVQAGLTKSIFYPASAIPEADDIPERQTGWTGHAPLVIRDSIPYTDFLFRNRRGAIETCSAQMLESMGINTDVKKYARVERPTFKPSRTLLSVNQGGPRRSWQMSSGYQTRDWAEWWIMEFLTAEKHWMLYNGIFVPVTVEPAKKDNTVYDKAKQQMPSVEFTVTLALEG